MRRTVIWRGAASTARSFRADFKSIPRHVRTTWAITLTVGWAATGTLMMGLVWAVRTIEGAGHLAFEEALLMRLVAVIPYDFPYGIWIETPGNAVFLIPVAVVGAIVAARMRYPLRALTILASFFFPAMVVMLGWASWDRPRPDIIGAGIGSPGLSAFPSGHVAQLISVAGLLVYLWVRRSPRTLERLAGWAACAALVALVASARLVLGSHWPTDLVGGAIVGGAWLAVMIIALRRAEGAMRRSGSEPGHDR